MKLIKTSLRILIDYAVSFLVFAIFLYVVLSLAKSNLDVWLSLYSFVIFILLVTIIFADMKKQALTEIKPQYDLKPSPFNGLIYGLIGFIPIIVLDIVSLLLVFNDDIANRINHIVLNTILGPLYFIIKLGGEQLWAYITVMAAVPIISMLSYMAGFYGIYPGKNKEKKIKDRIPSKYPYNKPTAPYKK